MKKFPFSDRNGVSKKHSLDGLRCIIVIGLFRGGQQFMSGWVRRALARKRMQRGKLIVEEPNERLVLGVKFAIGMTAFLSCWEQTAPTG